MLLTFHLLLLFAILLLKPLTFGARINGINNISHSTSFHLPTKPLDFMISDLYADDLNTFKLQAEDWDAELLISSGATISNCDSLYLGGPGILNIGGSFEKTFTSLPSHKILNYYIRFTIVDSWHDNDSFTVYFNEETIVSGWNLSQFKSLFPKNTCGNPSYKDLHELVLIGQITHTSNKLALNITSEINQHPNFASLGFRDIHLLFRNQATDNNNAPQIVAVSDPYINLNNYGTGCQMHEYAQYSSSVFQGCSPCHENCRECFGPLSDQCYACSLGTTFNGTHCNNCSDSNCDYCSGTETQQCLACHDSYWLYWNNTCLDHCDAPFLQQETDLSKVCSSPCRSDEFMLWDGSCSDSCNQPLVQRVEGKSKFCDFPCSDNQGQVLYSNQSCLATCDSPWVTSIFGGKTLCSAPCQSSNEYFYTTSKKCETSCDYPYYSSKILSITICLLDENDQKEAENLDQATILTNILDTISSVVALATSFLAFGDSGALSMMTLAKMLQYVKFININFPSQVRYMFKKQKIALGLFIFAPKLPQSAQNMFTNHQLPYNFEYYDMHSSFLVNFWQAFASLLIVITISFILFALEKILSNKTTRLTRLISFLKPIIKWNFILTMFCSYYGDISFYTALEFRTADNQNIFSIMSFLLCIITNTVVFFVLKIAFVVGLQKPTQASHIFNSKEKYGVLIEDFSQDTVFQKLFMFVFVFRAYIINAIIGYLFEYPLLQLITITLIGITMVLYVIIANPLKKLVFKIQYVAYELILLILDVCALTLGILDYAQADQESVRSTLGGMIILLNIIMRILPPFFMILKALLFYKDYLHEKYDPAFDHRNVHEHDMSSIMALQPQPPRQTKQRLNTIGMKSTEKKKILFPILRHPKLRKIIPLQTLDFSSPYLENRVITIKEAHNNSTRKNQKKNVSFVESESEPSSSSFWGISPIKKIDDSFTHLQKS